jgi:DNA-nicking Smr family endonuclease
VPVARNLRSDEQALWAKVVATVRPLHRQPLAHAQAASSQGKPAPAAKPPLRPFVRPAPREGPRNTLTGLDSSWERRLQRGLVEPDLVVDLHGLSLATAHARIDARLDEALGADARLLLLITGKPPATEGHAPERGRIRAAVEDWVAASRHAAGIAAVRPAHRRHGGKGALYIVLRRRAVRHRPNS